MREFLQAVYDYPWVTFFMVIAMVAIGNAFSNKK